MSPYHSALARGRVAQLVEQGIENPRVGGSIPSPATTTSSNERRKTRSDAGFLLPSVRCLLKRASAEATSSKIPIASGRTGYPEPTGGRCSASPPSHDSHDVIRTGSKIHRKLPRRARNTTREPRESRHWDREYARISDQILGEAPVDLVVFPTRTSPATVKASVAIPLKAKKMPTTACPLKPPCSACD